MHRVGGGVGLHGLAGGRGGLSEFGSLPLNLRERVMLYSDESYSVSRESCAKFKYREGLDNIEEWYLTMWDGKLACWDAQIAH